MNGAGRGPARHCHHGGTDHRGRTNMATPTTTEKITILTTTRRRLLMIGRRELIAGFGGAAAWPLLAGAQQPAKVWRIGVLETTSQMQNAANLGAFRQAMG